jgi:hypothetical protein
MSEQDNFILMVYKLIKLTDKQQQQIEVMKVQIKAINDRLNKIEELMQLSKDNKIIAA